MDYLSSCVSVCVRVCVREGAFLCKPTTQQYIAALHAVDLCSPGLRSLDPGLITVYHHSYGPDPTVTSYFTPLLDNGSSQSQMMLIFWS